jgi:tetratricopeptide (TPR) repeat protein
MQLMSCRSGALALIACGALALAAVPAAAQAPLLDVVHTVAGPDVPVPAEHTFTVNAAGTYHVILTDLGTQLTPPAPLASVEMAITSGNAIVGTPLTTAGTLTFTASAAGDYLIHVVATLSPPAQQGASPIGAIGINVTDANNNLLYTFSDTLAPPSTSVPNGAGVMAGSFQVQTSGSYQVSLTDLQFPQALSCSPAPCVPLTLIIIQEGQPNPVTILPGGANPVMLQASPPPPSQAIVYDIFALGTSDASPQAGLYSVSVTPAGGGQAVFSRTTPVGAVGLIGSPGLKAQGYTLSLTDLATPAPLAQLGALVELNGMAVAQVSGTGTQAFAGTANTYDVFALAEPAGGGAGSYALALQPAAGPSPLSVARAVSSPGGASAYSFDADIGTAGSYALNLADFAYPTVFGSLNALVVQSGAAVGTGLSAAGSTNVTLSASPASILVFAQAASTGGLFGVDLTQSGANAPAFAATQGVGQLFAAQQVNVVDAGSYQVNVQDLAFPAAFANLAVFVTRGSARVGSIFGGGSFPFQATPGNYSVTFLAQPASGNAFEAGTYAMTVGAGPPPPTVTLTASGTNVTSGSTVTVTWSSQNAKTCTASGSGWSGTQATHGSFTSAALTAQTTFTLTCHGDGGDSAPQTVTVNITSSSGGGGGALDALLLSILLGVLLVRLTSARTPRRVGSYAALAVLAVTSAALLTACGGAQSRFDSHMKRGEAYSAAGDYTTASVEFRNAMQIQPLNAKARLAAGQAAEKLGKPREALGLYHSVLDAAPDNLEARADVARIMVYGGATEQALKVIEPGLARHPDDAALLTLRAAAESRQGNRDAAVADVERALKLAPGNEEAIQVRAGLYKQSGDLTAATTLVSEAVRRAPSSTVLREMLADLYASGGQPEKAEEQLRALIGLAPRQLPYRYQLAVFYARANRLDDAQRVLEEAVKVLPKSDEAKLTLVDFVSARRSRAQGEQTLRSFIAREPDNYDLRLALGGLQQRAGAQQEATATYQEVIRLDGTGAKALVARNRLAAMALQGGRYDEARRLTDEVLKNHPRDNDALTLRAGVALAHNDAASAITDLRAVLRDQPDALSVRRLLAHAYEANGQPALAAEELRAASELAPEDVGLSVGLARVLLQIHQTDQAVGLLENAVRRAPKDVTARTLLAQGYLDKRDFAAARTAAHDLQTLSPDTAAGYHLAAMAAVGENRLDDAQRDFEHALSLAPQAYDSLSALARLQIARGRTDKAVERVRSATEHGEPNAAALNLLGELYLLQKKNDLAIDAFTRATAVTPKWWTPYRNLGLAKVAAGDPTGAMAAYEMALQLAPAEPQLTSELALLYERHGRSSDAIALYEQLHSKNPQVEGIANALALLLVTYRSDRASLDQARDLTSAFASSGDGALLDVNGWVHFKRGEYAQALTVLQRAVQLSPDTKQFRYHLGMTELSLGQTERARDDLEVAVSGGASFAGADEARTTLATLKKG